MYEYDTHDSGHWLESKQSARTFFFKIWIYIFFPLSLPFSFDYQLPWLRELQSCRCDCRGHRKVARPTLTRFFRFPDAASGLSNDWVHSRGVTHAYVAELRDAGSHGFVLPPSQIVPAAEEIFEGIKALVSHIAAYDLKAQSKTVTS